MHKVIFKSFFTAVLAAGLGFLANILTARILGPSGRGEYSSFILAATLIATFSQLGLGQAYVFAYRKDGFGRPRLVLSSCLAIILLCAAICSVLISFVADSRVPDSTRILFVLCMSMTAVSFCTFSSQTQKSLDVFNMIKLLSPALLLLTAIVARLQHQVTALHILNLVNIGNCISLPLVLWIVYRLNRDRSADRSDPAQDLKRVPGLMTMGLRFHGTVVLGLMVNYIDKIYLFFSASSANFGIYAVAYSLSRLVGFIQKSIATVLFSQFAGGASGLSEKSVLAFRFTFYPLTIMAILVVFIREPLVTLLFGHAFAAVALPFAILMFESIFSGASWMLAQQFNANGKPGLVLVRQMASFIPIVALLPFLHADSVAVGLASILLLSGTIRLVITIMLLVKVEGIPVVEFLPRIADVPFAFRFFRRLVWKESIRT